MTTCESCGAENPVKFRFCGSCGSPLGSEAAPGRESRRTVTIVFCDVTGSTALGERLDPESLRHVMAHYFDAMRIVIERHGGTVEKFIGDAVMAVYGVPVLHEDDALRAVRAAVEMREALTELNADLERDYGTTLLLRTGVNTGEVVAGTEERLATGDAVNVAARLEGAAEPGEILIGPDTYELVRDAVDAEALEPLALKGKSSGLAPYRLLRVHGGAPGRARRFDAPLVGRDREQRLLADAWDRAITESTCTLFTLLGSAGVGKSRLVAEFLRSVDATVVRGRCLSYGEGITYWPVVEVILQLLDGKTPEAAEPTLAADVRARLAPLLGDTAQPSSPEDAAWAVRKLFEAHAAETPLVVVFDDIHWGEPTFLDLVEHIASLSRGAPILLLCVARPELMDSRPTWSGGLLNATTVLLEPLTADESDVLIERLLGDQGIDPSLRARIGEAAAGNPLFLEEMLEMLRGDEADGDVVVPPTIQALLAARLDQLDAAERGVLERGSIEGEVFHRGAVQALAPAEAGIDARLMTLVRKELVRPDRATLPGEDAYRFRHLLIRDAAYDALSKATRAALHEGFARWLEENAPALVELDELVGYHLEQAYCYRKELGPVDEAGQALAEQAAERLARAGRGALERSDVSTAATLLGRAADVRSEHDPRRAEILLDLADALFDAGRLPECDELLEEAASYARELGDDRLGDRARLAQISFLAMTDPARSMPSDLAEIEAILAKFERREDLEGLAKGWGLVGRLRFFLGRAAEAEDAYARAVDHARRAGKPGIAQDGYSWWIGAKHYGPSSVPEALAFLDALPATALTSGRVAAYSLVIRAELEAMEGRFDEAREHIVRAGEITRDLGLEIRTAAFRMAAGHVEVLAGELEAAERELRESYEALGRLGETGFRATAGAFLARTLVALGRDAQAEPVVAEVERIMADDDFDPQAGTRAVRAALLSRAERHEEAETVAREAVALYEETDYLDGRADMHVALAEILQAAGRPDEGHRELEVALALYERKGNLVMAERVRGRLGESG